MQVLCVVYVRKNYRFLADICFSLKLVYSLPNCVGMRYSNWVILKLLFNWTNEIYVYCPNRRRRRPRLRKKVERFAVTRFLWRKLFILSGNAGSLWKWKKSVRHRHILQTHIICPQPVVGATANNLFGLYALSDVVYCQRRTYGDSMEAQRWITRSLHRAKSIFAITVMCTSYSQIYYFAQTYMLCTHIGVCMEVNRIPLHTHLEHTLPSI